MELDDVQKMLDVNISEVSDMKHVVALNKDRLNQLYDPLFNINARKTFSDMIRWCDNHLAGEYYIDNIRTWRFKLKEDAALFTLTWS